MRTEITKLHHRLATTFIYVTHDQVEAMTMGTRIVVMKDGFIQQVDAPQKLYDYPANIFVAGFIGTPQMNFFDAVITGTKANPCVEFEGQKLAISKETTARFTCLEEYLNTGKPVVLGVRPEDFHDEAEFIEKSKKSVINVRVDVLEKLGAESLLYCAFGELQEDSDQIASLTETATQLIAKIDARSATQAHTMVDLAIDMNHIHLFDKETELSILEGEGTKAYVPVVELERQAKRAEEERILAEEKAAKLAAKQAAKEAKAAAKLAKAEATANEEVVEENADSEN
jgi:multiple sugar transport system ATP-binding protein